MIRVFGLKNCDACRRAVKALGAEMVDIRVTPLSRAEFQRFYDAVGEDLLNTRSRTWRELDEDRRLDDPIELMMAFPALMKRPLIDVDGELFLGLGPEVHAATER